MLDFLWVPGTSWFYGFLFLCFYDICFSMLFVLRCFSSFPASLLLCFCCPCFFPSVFSLVLRFCISVPFYFYYSTYSSLQSFVFAASWLPCFLWSSAFVFLYLSISIFLFFCFSHLFLLLYFLPVFTVFLFFMCLRFILSCLFPKRNPKESPGPR